MADTKRLERQPFADILRARGMKIFPTGRYLGFDGAYAVRVARGTTAPSPEFKAALCAYLKMRERDLFTKSALATPYKQYKNARGLRRVESTGDAK